MLCYVFFSAFLLPGHVTGHSDPGAISRKGWLVAYVHECVSEVRLGHSLKHRLEDKHPLEETDLEDSKCLKVSGTKF